MTLRSRLRPWVVLCLAACATPVVVASGGGESPTDELVSRSDTDVGQDELLHGNVGIVLPTWNEAALYLAWRAIVSDGKLPHWPASRNAARSDVPAGWMDAASAPASAGADANPFADSLASAGGSLNCNDDTYAFALRTLHTLETRPDRSPARVDAWIDAQKRVFALCARDPLDVLADADPLFAPPPPLPPSEPLYWRQLRDYQLASMAFHGAHYAQSQQAFERIGKTPGHPMQPWGAYLALRSHLRALQVPTTAPVQTNAAGPTPAPPEQLAALEALRQEGAAILRDPALADVHAPTAATLRRAAFLLAPGHRFAELAAMLDDTRADPLRDDTLDDWTRVGYGTGDPLADARAFEALRAAHPWYDWLASVMENGSAAPPSPHAKPTPCATACQHAAQAWARGLAPVAGHPGDAHAPLHRAWLVAALMSPATLSDAMAKEALAVAPQAPEYATVRYYLAARLRAAGRNDEARTLSDDLLARLRATAAVPTSAVNLATQQRFAAATSVVDAAPYLLMSPIASTNPDTGERAPPVASDAVPSADGMRWLDRNLSVADMLTLARALKGASPWRTRIAVAAWMRSDLLGDAPAAADASRLVEQFVPALKPVTTRYRALPTAPERQHWLILNALRRGLSPEVVATRRDATSDYAPAKPEDTLADMWCRIGVDEPDDYFPSPDKAVPALQPPFVSSDPARRDAERARLVKVRSATGFVGAHAIAWAASHPADKDLPWLLAVAVQSSRGGCVDADHTAVSKKAWQLLHKRFPDSDWADQTPYFY